MVVGGFLWHTMPTETLVVGGRGAEKSTLTGALWHHLEKSMYLNMDMVASPGKFSRGTSADQLRGVNTHAENPDRRS